MKSTDKKEKNGDIVFKIFRDLFFLAGASVTAFTILNVITNTMTILQSIDKKTASIKEGSILKTKIETKSSKNAQENKIKKVVIDTNNNGIEDADDVVINGKLFTLSEAKEGRNVVFLQSKMRLKPLAVENENGDFDIKTTPSDIYNLISTIEKIEPVKDLENEFNNIIAQKTR